MVKIIQASQQSRNKKFGIVVSRYNEFITKRLLDGCLKELSRLGVQENQVTVVWVPGSFEIPLAALKLAKQKSVSGVICLGAIIRGETIHFDLVAKAVADGVLQVILKTEKPVVFGVLATETVNQAYKRSEAKGDHKGKEAARNVVEMVNLMSRI